MGGCGDKEERCGVADVQISLSPEAKKVAAWGGESGPSHRKPARGWVLGAAALSAQGEGQQVLQVTDASPGPQAASCHVGQWEESGLQAHHVPALLWLQANDLTSEPRLLPVQNRD